MSDSIVINRHVSNQGTLTIGRRQYRVELVIVPDDSPCSTSVDRCRYLLHGARGAVYTTCRNLHHPTSMFLISQKGKVTSHGLQNVWLSDANGELRVL